MTLHIQYHDKRMLRKPVVFLLIIVCVVSLDACGRLSAETDTQSLQSTTQSTGQIYLYGEEHGVKKIMDKEYALWNEYYHNEGMRHLFIEDSYYGAEFLNIWMQSDNDDVLEKIYTNLAGTAAHNPYYKDFYKKIKSDCPDTVFHGTDVGHQHDSTGKQFLDYLETNRLNDTEQYQLTLESIEQGKYFYGQSSDADVYRENMMAQNFIREFDKLGGKSCMGIYGNAHTGLNKMDYNTNSVPSMANQLKKKYGDSVHSEDLR